MKQKISIIGGGIAGLTTAIALKNLGIEATIFEAAPVIQPVGAGIVLAANAISAFRKLNIADEIMRHGRLLSSFTIYDHLGKTITKTDSKALSEKYGTDNFTIHRADLHQLLLSMLNYEMIYTNKRVNDLEQGNNSVVIKFDDGTIHETGFLIVADGINSVIRRKLIPCSGPRFSGYTCWRAVIENRNLNLAETSETWGINGRFGIAPLPHNKIYWFACINSNQNDETMKQFKVADLQNHFRDFHQPIPAILHQTKDKNLIWNDIIDLKPLNRYAFNNIVLIGDAAHATTPNMGQGACQAIEDAVILSDEIKSNSDITKAFRHFEKRRLKRTHYIINTSRTIGKVAQVENPILASIRNFAFRNLPKSFNERQVKKIYEVDF